MNATGDSAREPAAGDGKGKSVRTRLLDAAYRLFSTRGVQQVGVDTIVAEADCAKSSLYGNFRSKEGLTIAFLDRRERLWTLDWLETEVRKRARSPTERMLAIFDVFDEWFRRDDFEGCSFINTMLESERGSPVHTAAAKKLAQVRELVAGFARETDYDRPDELAAAWDTLMKGAIVSADEGRRDAALTARRAAEYLLESWPRR